VDENLGIRSPVPVKAMPTPCATAPVRYKAPQPVPGSFLPVEPLPSELEALLDSNLRELASDTRSMSSVSTLSGMPSNLSRDAEVQVYDHELPSPSVPAFYESLPPTTTGTWTVKHSTPHWASIVLSSGSGFTLNVPVFASGPGGMNPSPSAALGRYVAERIIGDCQDMPVSERVDYLEELRVMLYDLPMCPGVGTRIFSALRDRLTEYTRQ
jgi:hypothetical protein